MGKICRTKGKNFSHLSILEIFCSSEVSVFGSLYSVAALVLFSIFIISGLVFYFVLCHSTPSMMESAMSYYLIHIEKFFVMLVIPVIALITFDLLLVYLLLPFFQQFIHPIRFDYTYITKSMIFDRNYRHSSQYNGESINILSTPFRASEHYRFLLPRIFFDSEYNRVAIERYLKSLSHLIWTIRLMHKPIKEYTFLIFTLLTLVVFFILFYRIYYYDLVPYIQEICSFDPMIVIPKGKSKYVLIFLIIWLVYAIFRIRLITGSDFYFHYFRNNLLHGNEAKFELSRVRIIYSERIQMNEAPYLQKDYIVEELQNDIIQLKNNNQNVQLVVEFATAVLTMLIAQFVV